MYDPTVVGPYLILDYLGEGGAGAVYSARKDEVSPVMALKAVNVSQNATRRDQAQVKREIFIMEKLRHAHIVRLTDAGYDGEWLYYAMELCENGSVEELACGPRLPLDQLLNLCLGIARGVGYLHERQVVHRDLKPANILLASGGVPKVSDFGIALLPDDEAEPEGVRVGTPRYMAPEVRAGERASRASDVFQVGLLLYRILSGIEFHKAHKTSGLPKGATSGNFLSLSRFNADAPPPLDALVLRCLHPDPPERPRNSSEVAQALEHLISTR